MKFTTSAVLAVGIGLCATLFSPGCGAEDERPAVWGYIAPLILAPTCATASCHSEGAAVAGLDMSTPQKAYESLLEQKVIIIGSDTAQKGDLEDCDPMNKDPRCLSPRPIVSPGAPDQSRLVRMLRAEGAQRMPPDRPLAEADIALIERWIALGAKP